jgi:fructokinase
MSEKSVPNIVGLGEVLWDVLPSGARLGGAPANFAVFCARLGNQAALISSIGEDDYGIAASRILTQPDLDLRNLQTSVVAATGTVEVTFSRVGQPSYNISTDVAWDFIELTPGVHEAALTADAVCYGTLAQRSPVSRSTIRGFVEATGPECVRICDVNLRLPHCSPEILLWSMAQATVIKVSDEELPLVFALLSELISCELQPSKALRDTPQGAANSLLDQFSGCRLIAMTLGANGSMLTTREKTYKHPGFPVELADTVGAGDAFTAGLTHAYLRGASLAQMAKIGNLCGSFVASRPEASPVLSVDLMENIDAALRETPISVAKE